MSAKKIAVTDQITDQDSKLSVKHTRLTYGKAAFKGINCLDWGSNPSDSTFKQLIVSKLKKLTDKNTDNSKNPLLEVKPKFEGPFLYEPKTGNDWFVWLKYQHPTTGKFERFKYFIGFSDYKTKELKRQHGKALSIVIEDLLANGWSPFEEYNVFENHRNNNVVDLIESYLKEIKGNIRPNTWSKYNTELGLFKTWLIEKNMSHLDISEIKKVIVTNFLNEYKEIRNWSGKTYNHYLNDLTTFFNYYHHNYDEVIEKVPTLSLKRLPETKSGNSFWNDWQFAKLKKMMLENEDKLLYTFCSFIYYAALRNEAEAIYLRAGDFNFNNKTLRIESGTAKNRTTEYIPMYPDFLDLLYELGINTMDPELYIFGKTKDQKFVPKDQFKIGARYKVGQDYFARLFRPYKEALGIDKKEHGIYRYKHTRAVHLGEDGEDLYKIMKLFRHRDLATTMIYMRGLGVNIDKTEFNKGRKF